MTDDDPPIYIDFIDGQPVIVAPSRHGWGIGNIGDHMVVIVSPRTVQHGSTVPREQVVAAMRLARTV